MSQGSMTLSRQSDDVTMGRGNYHGYQQSCKQTLVTGSFTQKPGSFTHDPGGQKTWIFQIKFCI